MKLLGKMFAVAATALAVSSAAEARIQAIGDNTPDGSELLFNLVNYTTEKSYTLDLGITTAQYSANPAQTLNHWSAIMNADSNFQAFLSNYSAGHNVAWGVFGGNGVLNDVPDLPNFGFYTTSVTAAPSNIDSNTADINNTMGKWQTLVSEIQTQDSNTNNLSTFKSVGEQGYTGVYGNDLQTALPFAAMGPLGELYFVKERVNFDDFDTGELDVFSGKWRFNIVDGSANLGYSSNVAPIPVPAAVWMFGTGLLGLLGLNRRKAA